jgi:hypothetical protein
LKHASPKGVYVAPVPDEPLLWTGVLFVRKGKEALQTESRPDLYHPILSHHVAHIFLPHQDHTQTPSCASKSLSQTTTPTARPSSPSSKTSSTRSSPR